MRIYVLYDTVSETVQGQLMLYKSDAPAIRDFQAGMVQSGKQVHPHIGDYELRSLGTVDLDTGAITDTTMKVVCTGNQILAQHLASEGNQLTLLKQEA